MKIRLLIEKPSATKTANQLIQYSKREFYAKIRYLSDYPRIIFAIFDKKEVVIATELKKALQGSAGLWSGNLNIVGMAEQYFEILWLAAMESPCSKLPMIPDSLETNVLEQSKIPFKAMKD